MNNRIEGVYPTVDEALRAVDRLRNKGYRQNSITLVTNEEIRDSLTASVATDVTTQGPEKDQSFWDSVKDAFTIDNSYENRDNDPLSEHREAIDQGQVAVIVNEETDLKDPVIQANTQPNTIGPEGTRSYEEEQSVESRNEYPKRDRELTTDELEDYEKKG